jgi:hypothetical protein
VAVRKVLFLPLFSILRKLRDAVLQLLILLLLLLLLQHARSP